MAAYLPLLCLASTLVAQVPLPTGQVPGPQPGLFAPGFVCTGLPERDLALRPDGRELVVGYLGGRRHTCLAVSRFQNGRWSPLEVLPFSQNPEFMDLEPAYSPDGQRLLFLSTRPPAGQNPKPGWGHQNLWMVSRKGEGWGEPEMLPAGINNGEPSFFPSFTRDGTLYFCRTQPTSGASSVYRSRWVDGTFQPAERLPNTVNDAQPFNAAVAPDGSCLVFCSATHKDKVGRADYFVSFPTPEGGWTEPRNLGPLVNGPTWVAGSPGFSPDGKIFFFSSAREPVGEGARDHARLLQRQSQPENGLSDIYCMEAGFLARLRRP